LNYEGPSLGFTIRHPRHRPAARLRHAGDLVLLRGLHHLTYSGCIMRWGTLARSDGTTG